MSDEQTNFKVTDRRLFNPDGTPRDITPEVETTLTPTPPATANTTGAAAASEPAPQQRDTASSQAPPQANQEAEIDEIELAAA